MSIELKQDMADMSFTQTSRAMNQDGLTSHDKNPAPTIWVLAERHNKKEMKVTIRSSGDTKYFTGC